MLNSQVLKKGFFSRKKKEIKYWLFWHLKKFFILDMAIKLIITPKFLHFPDKQCLFTQNFAKQPYICFVPKVLITIFTPKNTLPKVKNSNMGLNHIFLGHPVAVDVFSNQKYLQFDTLFIFIEKNLLNLYYLIERMGRTGRGLSRWLGGWVDGWESMRPFYEWMVRQCACSGYLGQYASLKVPKSSLFVRKK